MKKFALVVLLALFILTPISLYAYSKNDISFNWMSDFFMHERHHEQMEEWINEKNQEAQLSEEESLFQNTHGQMYGYTKSTRFGCHN